MWPACQYLPMKGLPLFREEASGGNARQDILARLTWV
jgi:hypothetical protein